MTLPAFLIENWVLVAVAVVSGVLLFMPALRGAGIGIGGGIDPTEAVRLVNREKGVLVDVGEPAEYAAGHAGGARNVPFGQIEAPAAPGASQGARGLPTNKALPIVVLCANGPRAAKAAALLRKAGYERAVALSGGTSAWREANLPIEKAEKSA
jgi:rhodanese-related sulfurtransferase